MTTEQTTTRQFKRGDFFKAKGTDGPDGEFVLCCYDGRDAILAKYEPSRQAYSLLVWRDFDDQFGIERVAMHQIKRGDVLIDFLIDLL